MVRIHFPKSSNVTMGTILLTIRITGLNRFALCMKMDIEFHHLR